MDNRAYHLQALSHTAVSAALKKGAVTRQPCEICGATAQAHHDSYYPDKWLSIRWLCGPHHREWHRVNEPVWPTIFEYHPIDGLLHKSSRRRPYFRTQVKAWYFKVNGKPIYLAKDKDEAFRKWSEYREKNSAFPMG